MVCTKIVYLQFFINFVYTNLCIIVSINFSMYFMIGTVVTKGEIEAQICFELGLLHFSHQYYSDAYDMFRRVKLIKFVKNVYHNNIQFQTLKLIK